MVLQVKYIMSMQDITSWVWGDVEKNEEGQTVLCWDNQKG